MAKELGIPIKFSLDWDKNYKPTHVDYLKRETGLTSLTRKEYTEETKGSWYGDVICNNMILSPKSIGMDAFWDVVPTLLVTMG